MSELISYLAASFEAILSRVVCCQYYVCCRSQILQAKNKHDVQQMPTSVDRDTERCPEEQSHKMDQSSRPVTVDGPKVSSGIYIVGSYTISRSAFSARISALIGEDVTYHVDRDE